MLERMHVILALSPVASLEKVRPLARTVIRILPSTRSIAWDFGTVAGLEITSSEHLAAVGLWLVFRLVDYT